MSGRPTLDLRPPRRRDATPVATLAEQPPPVDRRPTREYPCVERSGSAPSCPGRPLFGEWLVSHGVLTREQLLQALSVSHLHEWRIGDAAVVLGHAPRTLVEAEAERFLSHRGGHAPSPVLERRARLLELEARRRRQRWADQGSSPG